MEIGIDRGIEINKIEENKSKFISFEVKHIIEKIKNGITEEMKEEQNNAFIIDIDFTKFLKK